MHDEAVSEKWVMIFCKFIAYAQVVYKCGFDVCVMRDV